MQRSDGAPSEHRERPLDITVQDSNHRLDTGGLSWRPGHRFAPPFPAAIIGACHPEGVLGIDIAHDSHYDPLRSVS